MSSADRDGAGSGTRHCMRCRSMRLLRLLAMMTAAVQLNNGCRSLFRSVIAGYGTIAYCTGLTATTVQPAESTVQRSRLGRCKILVIVCGSLLAIHCHAWVMMCKRRQQKDFGRCISAPSLSMSITITTSPLLRPRNITQRWYDLLQLPSCVH